MNKTVFRGLLWGLPLMIILACTPQKTETAPRTVSIEGTVIGLEGRVLVNGIEADFDSPVPDGAVITTDEEGYCEITFLGDNIIRIYENAFMKISFKDAVITVDRGAAAAVLRNLGGLLEKNDDVFQVESGNVVAGIRGTTFFLKKEDADTTYFCLCNGAIDLSDTQGRLDLPLQAVHHNALRVHERDGRITMSKALMENHTDAQMEALAGRIGQSMNWTVQE